MQQKICIPCLVVLSGFLLLMPCREAFSQRVAPAPYSTTAPVSYARAWESKAPQVDPNKILVTSSVDSFLMTTQYFDGLGRPIQTVARQLSPLKQDLVIPVVYDSFGREQFRYLPFASTVAQTGDVTNNGLIKLDAFQQDSVFYSNASSPIKNQGMVFFYGKTVFEASPFNRPQVIYATGDNWTGDGRGVQRLYLVNTTADSVRIWVPGVNPSDTPSTKAIYAPGQLYKNVTVDEAGNQVVEYKDKDGQVVLKKVQLSASPGTAHMGWLCTYYMYDDLGNLRYVLQPQGVVQLLATGNWTITNTIRDGLSFYYGYDARKRMTVKKVPGAGEVYMVYDVKDRLVMTQDANLRDSAKWLATLYDTLNRAVQTGLIANSAIGGKTFDQHLTSAALLSTYPFSPYNAPSGWDMLTQTGYDSYDSIPSGAPSGTLDNSKITSTNFFTTYNAAPNYAQSITQSTAVRGLVTWTKIKILNSTKYLYTVNIYDEKGRLIQVKSTNYTSTSSTTGVDVATTQYDFSGKVLRTHVAHQKSGTNAHTYYVLTKNAYDHGGRLLSITKKTTIDTQSPSADKIPVKYSYDELGRLRTKTYGTSLEVLTYDYNIRGWILGVNRGYSRDTIATNHYFGYELAYDKIGVTINGLSTFNYTPQYTGNIAGVVWKSAGDNQVRRYSFSYDAANRLATASFTQFSNQAFSMAAGMDFSTTGLTYDANGNILTMNQRGWKPGGSATIDSLKYTYRSNFANQLQNVVDLKNDTATRLGDFRSSKSYMTLLVGTKDSSAIDYTYDDNGNLTADLNKDIGSSSTSGIFYNYLNLPQKVQMRGKGQIDYIYDATGNKLVKIITDSTKGSPYKVTTTLYMMGNYVNDSLQFVTYEEGRMRLDTTGGVHFEYDYFLKDHLDNIRTVLTDQQKQDAYPAATMELVDQGRDTTFYNNVNLTRSTLPVGYPLDTSYSNPNQYVAKVNGSGNKIGPAIVLKVMAGDQFNVKVSSWYKQGTTTPGTSNSSLTDIVTALITGIPSLSEGKALSSELSSSGVLTNPVTSFLNTHTGTGYNTSRPKAFVNWVLLDEQFNFVGGSSGFEQVSTDTTLYQHQKTGLSISKNGYLYVYVSNETPNIDVFFDNLQVTHIRGPLLEETHYYPFGLTMAGISSKAMMFGEPENKKNKFQNQEYDDALGVDYYEFKYRNHDPQIGRFIQVDPLANKYVYNSTYAFSENHVTSHVELEGLEKASINDQKNITYGPLNNLTVVGKSVIEQKKPETSPKNANSKTASGNKKSKEDNSGKPEVGLGVAAVTSVTTTKNLPMGDKLELTTFAGNSATVEGNMTTMTATVDVQSKEVTLVTTTVGFGTVGFNNDGSLSFGISLPIAGGAEGHVTVGPGKNSMGQVGVGGSFTNKEGRTSGGDLNYHAGGTAGLAAVATFASKLLPILTVAISNQQ